MFICFSIYLFHNSKNRNELCAFWASIGECEHNRIFMLPHCAAACRFCLLSNTNVATNVD